MDIKLMMKMIIMMMIMMMMMMNTFVDLHFTLLRFAGAHIYRRNAHISQLGARH